LVEQKRYDDALLLAETSEQVGQRGSSFDVQGLIEQLQRLKGKAG
jgi:hypothetical protein